MARAERSHVRKRRRGCLGGCLTRIVLLLGLAALLFVAACVLGVVKNDPLTGKPELSLEGVGPEMLQNIKLPKSLEDVKLPDVSWLAKGISLPAWAYGVSPTGLTVKTLRAGEGEAVLVCADGYTMLVGGGSGMGVGLSCQLLLCGARKLNVAVAPSAEKAQIGALALALRLTPPDYLLYQDTQVKGAEYHRMVDTAQKMPDIELIAPRAGLTFSLGRGTVTVLGPARTPHTDERDDGLTLRVDYGATSVLIAGSITQNGERELISSRVRLGADALICARGGSEEATCAEFVSAVSPKIALMTGKDAPNATRVRLTRAGAKVYAAADHGVMTLYSDGRTITAAP